MRPFIHLYPSGDVPWPARDAEVHVDGNTIDPDSPPSVHSKLTAEFPTFTQRFLTQALRSAPPSANSALTAKPCWSLTRRDARKSRGMCVANLEHVSYERVPFDDERRGEIVTEAYERVGDDGVVGVRTELRSVAGGVGR